MDFDSPIYGVALAFGAGVALIMLARYARGLRDPFRGFVALSLGDASFTEILGVFLIGYAIGALVAGPAPSSGGPPRPPGAIVSGRFGPASALIRGGLPVTTGLGLAFITFLWRIDVIGKLSNPQSHKALAAIIGQVADAVDDIPAGGHGQI